MIILSIISTLLLLLVLVACSGMYSEVVLLKQEIRIVKEELFRIKIETDVNNNVNCSLYTPTTGVATVAQTKWPS